MTEKTATIAEGTPVFVTKYAISGDGKATREIAQKGDGEYVHLKDRPVYYSLKLNKECFLNEEEADVAILAAFDRKIAQVKKQLARLEKIRAEVAERVKGRP